MNDFNLWSDDDRLKTYIAKLEKETILALPVLALDRQEKLLHSACIEELNKFRSIARMIGKGFSREEYRRSQDNNAKSYEPDLHHKLCDEETKPLHLVPKLPAPTAPVAPAPADESIEGKQVRAVTMLRELQAKEVKGARNKVAKEFGIDVRTVGKWLAAVELREQQTRNAGMWGQLRAS